MRGNGPVKSLGEKITLGKICLGIIMPPVSLLSPIPISVWKLCKEQLPSPHNLFWPPTHSNTLFDLIPVAQFQVLAPVPLVMHPLCTNPFPQLGPLPWGILAFRHPCTLASGRVSTFRAGIPSLHSFSTLHLP